MKTLTLLISVTLLALPAAAQNNLRLGNDIWPPFIVQGDHQGTAEALVCQTLERAGYACEVIIGDWQQVIDDARGGDLDGIAAVWMTPERESFLLFSDAYLTNRLVPVLRAESAAEVTGAEDLAGLRVALVSGYAYGEKVDGMRQDFTAVEVPDSTAAMEAVRTGEADVALVDELVARQQITSAGDDPLYITSSVIASRSLHFAMSREDPRAAQVIELFNTTYRLMLQEGRVNEILNVDWLATDLGQDGLMDVVLRKGASLADLEDPSELDSTYALSVADFQTLRQRDFDARNVRYQVEGRSHSDVADALGAVFGKEEVCKQERWTSIVRCDIEPPPNRR